MTTNNGQNSPEQYPAQPMPAEPTLQMSQASATSHVPEQQHTPPYIPYIQPAALPKKEKRSFSIAEKLLLLAALAIAILFDRALPHFFTENYTRYYAAFSLCFLAVFYVFFWKKLRHNVISWYLTGCITALCAWSFIFWEISGNGYFGLINFPVIPAVIMGLIVYMTGNFELKEAGSIAIAWLSGVFIKPFSGIHIFFGAIGASLFGEGKSKTKKAALGIAITLPLLLIILPLLSSADRAFGYHLMQILSNFNFATMIWHLVVITTACILVYSFLWNVGFGGNRVNVADGATLASEVSKKERKETSFKIDTLISSIILGSIALLYTVFCIVQFTYLFAGTGLPGGITYSEYAREGFAQTVVVCAINLLIFGVLLHFRKQSKITTGLLIGLLALTGVMLFSGFIRLGLYIDYYGMTWLRLLSAWFIIYLAAVIIMCGIRLWREKLPLIAVSTMVLVGWYVILGYTNPGGFVAWYNQMLDYDAVLSTVVY